jgi:putative ABC transport system permease protein
MKAVIYALRSFGRELRSGEVIVLLAAVALAVAALTAVGFLTDRIGRAVARQANEVLAADLRLRTPDPIPAEWHDMAAEYGLQSAETQTFPSVVFVGNLSSLATIKGVSEGYPLRGDVRVSDSLFGTQRIAEGIPDSGNVWADGALMARLDVSVGDYISIGESEMRIDAVLRYRPDQSIGFASLAPSLVIDTRDLPATGLVNEGSRVRYALLVAGDERAVDEFWENVEPTLPDSVRSRNREEGSDRANNASDRAQRFLSLTAVISLLLSAVLAASRTGAWTRSR